mgnify:CR=1 FL=1
MMTSIYGLVSPTPDPWESDRQNRMYEYLKEKIGVEVRLNPYPTDEGYTKLMIEVAKSCCTQIQRIDLIEMIEPKNENNDE